MAVRNVAGLSHPSLVSIHAAITSPEPAAAMPSNEWEIGLSSLMTIPGSNDLPPSRDLDSLKSFAKRTPSGFSFADDHETYTSPPGPVTMPGDWWAESTDSPSGLTRTGFSSPVTGFTT